MSTDLRAIAEVALVPNPLVRFHPGDVGILAPGEQRHDEEWKEPNHVCRTFEVTRRAGDLPNPIVLCFEIIRRLVEVRDAPASPGFFRTPPHSYWLGSFVMPE
jgi:hypothetical protein